MGIPRTLLLDTLSELGLRRQFPGRVRLLALEMQKGGLKGSERYKEVVVLQICLWVFLQLKYRATEYLG